MTTLVNIIDNHSNEPQITLLNGKLIVRKQHTRKERVMGKIADRYYTVDPWSVSEEGFDKERSEVSESIFSLANEYMGIRGYFEEGYSGERLLGSYFNGIYENSPKENRVKYKGSFRGVILWSMRSIGYIPEFGVVRCY